MKPSSLVLVRSYLHIVFLPSPLGMYSSIHLRCLSRLRHFHTSMYIQTRVNLAQISLNKDKLKEYIIRFIVNEANWIPGEWIQYFINQCENSTLTTFWMSVAGMFGLDTDSKWLVKLGQSTLPNETDGHVVNYTSSWGCSSLRTVKSPTE